MIQPLAQRFGWRGLWLIVMGLLWILFGIGVLLTPVDRHPWVLFEIVPSIYRAPIWWVTGLIAIWQGTRGPVSDDSPGHVALYVMPAVRIVSFAASALVYCITWALTSVGLLSHTSGWADAWYATLVWSFVSIMLALGASWPNPNPPLPRPPSTPVGDDE